MKKRWIKFGSIGLATALITALLISFMPDGKVSVGSEGRLSLESRIALAAQTGGTFGNGEVITQQVAEAIFSRGGPPVVSVAYNDPPDLDDDALTIFYSCGIPHSHVPKRDFVEQKPGEREAEREAEAEGRCKKKVNQSLEVWTLLSEFPADDPVRQDPPVLLDNERIEKVKGKNYLVTTLAYFDVHIFSFEPLRFITRINGLEAGPITGEWWK